MSVKETFRRAPVLLALPLFVLTLMPAPALAENAGAKISKTAPAPALQQAPKRLPAGAEGMSKGGVPMLKRGHLPGPGSRLPRGLGENHPRVRRAEPSLRRAPGPMPQIEPELEVEPITPPSPPDQAGKGHVFWDPGDKPAELKVEKKK